MDVLKNTTTNVISKFCIYLKEMGYTFLALIKLMKTLMLDLGESVVSSRAFLKSHGNDLYQEAQCDHTCFGGHEPITGELIKQRQVCFFPSVLNASQGGCSSCEHFDFWGGGPKKVVFNGLSGHGAGHI